MRSPPNTGAHPGHKCPEHLVGFLFIDLRRIDPHVLDGLPEVGVGKVQCTVTALVDRGVGELSVRAFTGNCWRGSTRPRPRGYGAPACYARRPPNAGHRSNPLNGFDTGPAGCRRPVPRGSCARIPPSPGPVVLPSLCCRRWKPSVPNHRHPHPLFIGIRCATEHEGRMRSPTTMGGRCIKTPPCAVAAKRVSASDQVRPWSSEIRRRTSEVSWFPAFWAV